MAAIILTYSPAIPTWAKADLEDAVGNESLCSCAMISSVLYSFLLGGFRKISYLSDLTREEQHVHPQQSFSSIRVAPSDVRCSQIHCSEPEKACELFALRRCLTDFTPQVMGIGYLRMPALAQNFV